MSDKLTISVVFGTRPEAIKLAPVILGLRDYPSIKCHVCVTAQHRHMLDQVLDVFGIRPDVDLDLMKPDQTLAVLTARTITGIDEYLAQIKPDMMLVQGDTTTVFGAAVSAFYRRIPVGHVEAGLRTGNLMSPWPEEANRVLTTRLAKWHFAPTEFNRQTLLREGVVDSEILVTGNTVIDALRLAIEKIKTTPPLIEGVPNRALAFLETRKMVLITGHRRENFGDGFENICHSIAELAKRFSDVHFIYPVHLNPNVQKSVQRILGKTGSGNIHLIGPQNYLQFVALMNRAHLILTDSGGVQEEAPSLGKPVIVLRNETERHEAITAGTVKLVGTDPTSIITETSRLLTDNDAYTAMSRAHNPYGDGQAAKRICDFITMELCK